jgi:hypothetical protein
MGSCPNAGKPIACIVYTTRIKVHILSPTQICFCNYFLVSRIPFKLRFSKAVLNCVFPMFSMWLASIGTEAATTRSRRSREKLSLPFKVEKCHLVSSRLSLSLSLSLSRSKARTIRQGCVVLNYQYAYISRYSQRSF